jgi:hypothetical protein
LAQAQLAILGGETWLVAGDAVLAVVPQIDGLPALEHWSCERRSAESWSAFVARSATEARRAIQSIPALTSADLPEGAVVHYNLTWVSEPEYDDALANKALNPTDLRSAG